MAFLIFRCGACGEAVKTVNRPQYRGDQEEVTPFRCEDCKVELSGWIEKQIVRLEATELIPERIDTFLQDLNNMEPRIQKDHLQGVLKSAYVFGQISLHSGNVRF